MINTYQYSNGMKILMVIDTVVFFYGLAAIILVM